MGQLSSLAHCQGAGNGTRGDNDRLRARGAGPCTSLVVDNLSTIFMGVMGGTKGLYLIHGGSPGSTVYTCCYVLALGVQSSFRALILLTLSTQYLSDRDVAQSPMHKWKYP